MWAHFEKNGIRLLCNCISSSPFCQCSNLPSVKQRLFCVLSLLPFHVFIHLFWIFLLLHPTLLLSSPIWKQQPAKKHTVTQSHAPRGISKRVWLNSHGARVVAGVTEEVAMGTQAPPCLSLLQALYQNIVYIICARISLFKCQVSVFLFFIPRCRVHWYGAMCGNQYQEFEAMDRMSRSSFTINLL